MVIVTVDTVGYGETLPVDTTLLRAITISTIVLGCTGMIYLTGALMQFITLNQINQLLGVKRMSTQIDRLLSPVAAQGWSPTEAAACGRAAFLDPERADGCLAPCQTIYDCGLARRYRSVLSVSSTVYRVQSLRNG